MSAERADHCLSCMASPASSEPLFLIVVLILLVCGAIVLWDSVPR